MQEAVPDTYLPEYDIEDEENADVRLGRYNPAQGPFLTSLSDIVYMMILTWWRTGRRQATGHAQASALSKFRCAYVRGFHDIWN
jgi:hypothetical protein